MKRLEFYLEYAQTEKNYELQNSSIDGQGVFSLSNFSKGDFINVHFFKNGDELTITKFGRYLNHSYKPNAISKKDETGYKVYALKNIKKGDEITLDYTINKELEQPPFD